MKNEALEKLIEKYEFQREVVTELIQKSKPEEDLSKELAVRRFLSGIINDLKYSVRNTDSDTSGDLHIADISSSSTRTIRMQRGLTQFEYTLPEDDAMMFMLILKRNKIWFVDVTR